ncbi:hypothetical protein CTheo_5095 [Ceratobasidium theobromae]|uniref:Uncharacterized protein n=1 Tax=Ceratobasidium theobromae TaxID=1582974 RepID=A0A5N5QI84_9AGAM|nr:hypothetical protein CTheo_5095 [Ceratobasidium theobromae]
MPKNLLVFFGRSYPQQFPANPPSLRAYSNYLESRVRRSRENERPQLVDKQRIPTPDSESKSKLRRAIHKMLRRKSSSAFQLGCYIHLTLAADPGPLYHPESVAAAYSFLSKEYHPGDKIIIFGFTGALDDLPVDAGTQPQAQPISPGIQDPWNTPVDPRPNHLLGQKIPPSCIALTYRAQDDDIGTFNNQLLEQFPSVKRIFSFNWADSHESWCNNQRDPSGQLKLREVGNTPPTSHTHTFPDVHVQEKHMARPAHARTSTPAYVSTLTRVQQATKDFVHYQAKFTAGWSFVTPIKGGSRGSRSGSSTPAPSTSTSTSSGQSDSDEPTPASSISSLSHASAVSVPQNPPTSTDFLTPPGMNRHQVVGYAACGIRGQDYYLPERVVWRSVRE